MGLFRPAATVSSPTGDYWELYVSKTALPAWKRTNADDAGSVDMIEEFGFFAIPLMLLTFLWANLVWPLLRVVFLLPFAVARGRRSRAVRIEAVKTFPRREVLLWTTIDNNKKRVLQEIVAGLAQGKVVQPEGAVYSGAER